MQRPFQSVSLYLVYVIRAQRPVDQGPMFGELAQYVRSYVVALCHTANRYRNRLRQGAVFPY